MINFPKNKTLNLKILKFLLISPLLVSIPLFTNISDVQARLEFQWDQDSGFRRLKWFQKQDRRAFRNKIYFFLRPSDRKADLLKINLAVPKHFKAKIKEENLSLCKVKIGGFDSRTKCLEDIPSDIEINNDPTSLVFYPYKPIPTNKDSYAVVLKLVNPKRSGLYQFHSFGQEAGRTVSSYLGSWTIVID